MRLQAAVGELFRQQLTGYTEAVVANTPTSYWRLGEPSGTSAVDARGVQNGTYTNGPTLGVVGAVSHDTAVKFASASSQYVTIPDLAALRPGTGNFSIELWGKRNGHPGASEFVLNKGDAPAGTGYELFINSAGKLISRIGAVQLTGQTDVCDNLWHHVVVSMTRAGNGVIYIDGVPDVTTSIAAQSATNLNSTAALELARRSSGNYFNGWLDEVAIYIGTALSQAQITSRFVLRRAASGIAFTPAGTIASTDVQAAIEEVASEASGVSSLAKSGSTGLTGAVTLSEGTNITLIQSGNNIAIAGPGGGAAPSVLSIEKWASN